MDKVEFDPRISYFFSNYLVGRKTKYFWNNFSSLFFDVNIGVEQGLALSSILSALYLLLVSYIFEKRLKNLKIPISFISFVDNSLLIFQNKFFKISNANLFCSYYIICLLLDCFELVIKQGKTEVFHFSRAQKAFNSLSFNLFILGGSVLCSKETWRYLGFIFNKKLFFCHYINFYTNKAILTVKSMKTLGNSLRSLIPTQNIFYIGHVFFLLHYMASLCSTTIMPHYHIYSKFLNIYKREPLFGFLEHSKLLCLQA